MGPAFLLPLIFLGLSLFIIRNWLKKMRDHWPSQGVYLLNPDSMIGRFMKADFKFTQQDVRLYQELKKNGERFGGYIEMGNPIFYPIDLDLIKNILIKDFDHFSDHRPFATEHDPHLYQNLFNLRGEAWRDLRVKMTPAFTTGKMRRLEGIINESAEKFVASLNKNTPNGSAILELRPFLQNVIMDLIANASFGVKTDIFDNPENSAFKQMGNRLLKTFQGFNILKFLLIIIFPRIASFLKLKLLDQTTDDFFAKLVKDVVQLRKDRPAEIREDFLQSMLHAQKLAIEEGNSFLDFDENVLIAQCVVFILGGFETVEGLMSWAVYELAVCPDVQERLYKDIKKAVDENGGKFSYDVVVNDLTYLDGVVNETLRKYPPAVRLDRKVTKPYKIPDSDVTLPLGAVVAIPTYAIQHDDDLYPDPEKFIPERFTKENVAARHPCAFSTFGVGPRSCIGNRFALVEAKYAIAHLIYNFKLEPCDKTNIPPVLTMGGSLKPIDLVPLKVSRRQK